jgi:hypothetical protein
MALSVSVRQSRLAAEAFTVGQSVVIRTDPNWPAKYLVFSPEQAGMAMSLLESHPKWACQPMGHVDPEVRLGKAAPRPATTINGGVIDETKPGLGRVLGSIRKMGYPLRRKGSHYVTRCPNHGGKSANSLKITETRDGVVLMKCFSGCKTEDVLKAIAR